MACFPKCVVLYDSNFVLTNTRFRHHSHVSISRFYYIYDLILLKKAYDQHLNLILGEVEETVTTTEIDDETDEEIIKKQTRKVGMLFVRGDIVVLVSPPLRTG